ncbi:hypothetical protein A2U01_0071840, partial [Trifolium medium]|nr:hypothetical protein [Trifolium medium]
MFKRKRTEQADPEKAQPASEDVETDADTDISKSPNNNAPIFQAQTSPISSSLNQPLPEINDDIDPTLFQPINVIHPPKMPDLPNFNSDTDIDSVIEGVEL